METKWVCMGCSIEFFTKRKGIRKFCNPICAKKYYAKRTGLIGSGLPTSTTGILSELRVCCDLLAKGYEVFKAVSPAASCDLAILKDGKLWRVEVRTAYRNLISGKLVYPKTSKDNGRQELFACVLRNEIIYIPELQEELQCLKQN